MLLNSKFKKILTPSSLIKIYILTFFLILISLLDLISLGSIPVLVGSLFDSNFFLNLNIDFLQRNLSYIQESNIIPIVVIFLFILKGFLNLVFIIYLNYFYRDLSVLLSNNLFKKYLSLEYLKINKYTTSILIRNLINEINLTIDYIKLLVNFSKEILLFFFIFIGCLFFKF